MGMWKRRPQLLEPRLLVGGVDLVTTATPGGLKKSKESNERNSPSARWLCVAKLGIFKRMTWGVLLCDILIARKTHFPWKIRQLLEHGSTAIDPAVAQFWHELIGESPP